MRNWSPLVANAVVFALAVALEEWQKVAHCRRIEDVPEDGT